MSDETALLLRVERWLWRDRERSIEIEPSTSSPGGPDPLHFRVTLWEPPLETQLSGPRLAVTLSTALDRAYEAAAIRSGTSAQDTTPPLDPRAVTTLDRLLTEARDTLSPAARAVLLARLARLAVQP